MTPPQGMPFLAAERSMVPASQLEDVTVARGVAINLAAARSVHLQLTTARVGLTLDLARAPRAH